ncbi:MAG: cupin domain-containing protein [Ginsengibacter sp.]
MIESYIMGMKFGDSDKNRMENVKEYIESGILELYVLGVTTDKENEEVEKIASSSYEIRKEIEDISIAIEAYARGNAIAPAPTIRPFLMAVIDYTERLKNGEQPSFPPILNKDSKIADYEEWISQADSKFPQDFKDFHAKIIGYTPEVTTAIVWIKDMAPQEVHDREFEKFLILEGTCTITIEEDAYHLVTGDVLSIPLYKKHDVKITSAIPCKVILQRVAA